MEFADAYAEIANAIDKPVYLIFDASDVVEPLSDDDQKQLVARLMDLTSQDRAEVHILAFYRSGSTFFDAMQDTGVTGLNMAEHTGEDIKQIIRSGLAKMSSWSNSESEEAFNFLCERANGDIRYITESALPFLREPFQRPLSRHLAGIPQGLGEKYS